MTNPKSNTQPSHAVYVIEGDGPSAFWTKVGSAWAHNDGDGFNIQLTALPLTGRLAVRKAKPQSDTEGR